MFEIHFMASLANLNSLSSLYLVRLDEQLFRALSKYFSGKDVSAP